jgi:hypothetical protein
LSRDPPGSEFAVRYESEEDHDLLSRKKCVLDFFASVSGAKDKDRDEVPHPKPTKASAVITADAQVQELLATEPQFRKLLSFPFGQLPGRVNTGLLSPPLIPQQGLTLGN